MCGERKLGSFALVLLVLGLIARPALAQSALDQRIREEVNRFQGKVSLFAKNLDTGETCEFGADDRVRTASTIKVPVMVEAFARMADGSCQWTEELILTDQKKVSGSGVLQELSDGLKLTLRDAVTLMMVLSDNTATNLVLDRLTTDAVNDRMKALGLRQTRVLRKIGGGGVSKAGADPANEGFGLGVATPREMVLLLERIEKGEVVSSKSSQEMIELMKRQQHRDGIGRSLLGVEMAAKSGALDRLRSEVGIIYSERGRIAMAITCDNMPETNWTVDNPGYLLLSRLSTILIEGLARP